MQLSGPWDRAQVAEFLDRTAVPLRLAVNGSLGFPVMASLWFVREGDDLLCATSPRARLVELLHADPRCGFEVSPDQPPYRGVRGRAEATLAQNGGGPLLERLLARYAIPRDGGLARWLLARADEEVVISLSPLRVLTWDYGRRMTGG